MDYKTQMNFNKLTNTELISAYSDIIQLLKERGVIRTKNLLGDLGEYLAIEHFNNTSGLVNLQAAPAGTQNIDAISRNGERYSIKSTSTNLTSAFHGLEPINSTVSDSQKFEYVLIMQFGDNFQLNKIIQLTWNTFLKHKKWHKTLNAWNITVTNSLIEDSEVLFEYQPEKAYSISEKRKAHKQAYEQWTNEADEQLELMYCEGKSVKELSIHFERNEGAIRTRIKKLGLDEKYAR
ncbi:MAG: hypothetical protein AAGG59_08325 [Bacteroidota bacterium]